MATKTAITAARLRAILHYEPLTGAFTWVGTKARRISNGDEAGTTRTYRRKTPISYRFINVDYHPIGAHRLAWLYMTGDWPDCEIDHKDGDGTNNRWSNLRAASSFQNKCNKSRPITNRTGLKGVSICSTTKKYRATINAHRRQHSLGRFDCPAAAYLAYVVAADEFHGEFARVS